MIEVTVLELPRLDTDGAKLRPRGKMQVGADGLPEGNLKEGRYKGNKKDGQETGKEDRIYKLGDWNFFFSLLGSCALQVAV